MGNTKKDSISCAAIFKEPDKAAYTKNGLGSGATSPPGSGLINSSKTAGRGSYGRKAPTLKAQMWKDE